MPKIKILKAWTTDELEELTNEFMAKNSIINMQYKPVSIDGTGLLYTICITYKEVKNECRSKM